MIESEIIEKYHQLTEILIERELTIAAMESCTGGLIGALLSDKEGASAVVPGGFFTYSNETKILSGVPENVIEKYGVYSKETALSMASACRERIGTDIGIGVTGSIGTTDPNNADSVPGEVYAAIETDGARSAERIELPDLSRWESRFFIADKLADMIIRVTIHG